MTLQRYYELSCSMVDCTGPAKGCVLENWDTAAQIQSEHSIAIQPVNGTLFSEDKAHRRFCGLQHRKVYYSML